MKGNEKVIAELNINLIDEITAINQYMMHSEMCKDWGYEKLHEYIEKRALKEMEHAEELMERILFLEGKPIVTKLNKIMVGKDVPAMMANDHAAELDAIKSYNKSIAVCVAEGDNGSRALLEANLKDEEEHIDWIEAQQDQIDQMGIQLYLSTKI
ncbi:MAG TPA: bacterioferritin [Bellilinea sp.]|nr:bacterioferritin [Bellilinea sp.]